MFALAHSNSQLGFGLHDGRELLKRVSFPPKYGAIRYHDGHDTRFDSYYLLVLHTLSEGIPNPMEGMGSGIS